ncbi:hypothetical protein PENSPDRAFT_739244 [Peniophora sp. CONT]|nr:hypothetical protein PENSPDRAFT_739244 [Peniophora sp. CONT]
MRNRYGSRLEYQCVEAAPPRTHCMGRSLSMLRMSTVLSNVRPEPECATGILAATSDRKPQPRPNVQTRTGLAAEGRRRLGGVDVDLKDAWAGQESQRAQRWRKLCSALSELGAGRYPSPGLDAYGGRHSPLLDRATRAGRQAARWSGEHGRESDSGREADPMREGRERRKEEKERSEAWQRSKSPSPRVTHTHSSLMHALAVAYTFHTSRFAFLGASCVFLEAAPQHSERDGAAEALAGERSGWTGAYGADRTVQRRAVVSEEVGLVYLRPPNSARATAAPSSRTRAFRRSYQNDNTSSSSPQSSSTSRPRRAVPPSADTKKRRRLASPEPAGSKIGHNLENLSVSASSCEDDEKQGLRWRHPSPSSSEMVLSVRNDGSGD